MLKNIQQVIQLPMLPSSPEGYDKYNNELQRALEDYTRVLSDNIMEQPRWEDFRIAASVAKPGIAAPTYRAFGPSGSLQALMFATGPADQSVHFEVQIPHSAKVGTKLYPHVHFSPTTTGTGNVLWGLEYSWANIGGVFGAPTIILADKTVNGIAFEHLLATFDPIEIEFEISSMLVCRLFRDVSGDNYNTDAALLEFDIHFMHDSIGSREEYKK